MSRFAPLQQRKDVWLNDLPFSSVDELGNRWLISDIDGWWDLPSPSMGEVDRAYSEDGAYYEPGRLNSRTIRMTGKIIPPHNGDNSANLARQALNRRLILVRKTGLLQVLESPELGGGKQSEVVIVARPLVSAKSLNGTLEFDIQFRAPDPRKYSVDLITTDAYLSGGTGGGRTYNLQYNRSYVGAQTRNTALVQNDGDYNTYGVIRLHGPVDSPGAHHLGVDRHIKFPGLRLEVGQYIDINLGEKTIISESGISLRDRMDDASRWFNFAEGDNRVSLLGTQYLDPVPSVPDVTNLVTDPSYEGITGDTTVRTVRNNITKNPSGSTYTETTEVRQSIFTDPQATNPDSFVDGTISSGYVTSPSIRLMGNAGEFFAVTDTTTHHFVQMEVKPVTTGVTTAELVMGNKTSGVVPLTQNQWTKIRVDSYVPSGDYGITLNVPGASSTNKVQLRNIMVLTSPTPIAGDITFWNPVVGETSEGVRTEALEFGGFRQYYEEPLHWTLPDTPDSLIRILENSDGEGEAYIIPKTSDPHVIDFGKSNGTGTDITFGVLGEGITEIRLYNATTGDLLMASPPSHIAMNYQSEAPISTRLEATVSVDAGGDLVSRKISSVMVTYDGGSKIFTELSPSEDGYTYSNYSTYTTAQERIDSFTSNVFGDAYHVNSREVQTRAYDGYRSLEVVYNVVPEDELIVEPTPITKPTSMLPPGTYYVRGKIMTNKATAVEVKVDGVSVEESITVGANQNNWADVSFSFDMLEDGAPFLTVTPTAGERDLEIYVDTVGIMTDNHPYFDGSMPGPYTWSGAPNNSTSATIPVVGVPNARMEIMHRNAWIG